MRDSNRFGIRTPAAGHRVLLAAFLCAGLLLTGCRSGSVTSVEDSSDEDDVIETIVTDTDASAGSTDAPAGPADPLLQPSETAALSATDAAPVSPAGEEGSTFSAEGKDLLIVLDPGHSSQIPDGTEPIGPGSSEMKEADTVGTYGPASALHEYELTMRVSQKLRTELEKRGYEVHLTHLDTVQPISCVERAEVANENSADAFIRIHANGTEDTSAHGAMTICITSSNPYHPELYSASKRLSEVLLDSYCQGTGASREKVWETDTMTGNNWAEVPTTLIELGYMTNPDEDLMMAMDSYQKKMVLSIADGLDRWFAEMPASELAMHPTLTGGQRAGGNSETAGPDSQGDPAQTVPGNPVEITNDGSTVQNSQTQPDQTGPVEITDDNSAEQNGQTQPDQTTPVEITNDSSAEQNSQTQPFQSTPVEITDDSESGGQGTGDDGNSVEIEQEDTGSNDSGAATDHGSVSDEDNGTDTQQDSEDSEEEEENTGSLGVPFR